MNEVNDRINKIDIFLKSYAKTYKEVDIYKTLSIYGLSQEELSYDDSSELLSNINKHYNKKKKMFIKEPIRTGYMPGFVTLFNSLFNDFNCVKLYFNFPRKNLESSVTKIIDYIEKNKIGTSSKVAQTVRTESLVVRVNTVEDANKIINFVSNDKKLKVSLKGQNPFVFSESNIGISYDGDLSYNRFVATILEMYFEQSDKNNTMNQVGYNDFRIFLWKFYRDTFQTMEGIKNFRQSKIFNVNFSRLSNLKTGITEEELMLNFKKVCEMFMISIEPEQTFDNVMQSIKGFKDEELDSAFKLSYKDVLSPNTLLDEYINVALDKYSNLENDHNGFYTVCLQLNEFMKQGDYNLITSTNNLRERFQQADMARNIYSLVNGSVEVYVDNIVRTKERQKSQYLSNNVSDDDRIQLLNLYISSAINKYGFDETIQRINLFLNESDVIAAYNLITRDNISTSNNRSFRELFIEKDMLNYLRNYIGLDIRDYMYNNFNAYSKGQLNSKTM